MNNLIVRQVGADTLLVTGDGDVMEIKAYIEAYNPDKPIITETDKNCVYHGKIAKCVTCGKEINFYLGEETHHWRHSLSGNKFCYSKKNCMADPIKKKIYIPKGYHDVDEFYQDDDQKPIPLNCLVIETTNGLQISDEFAEAIKAKIMPKKLEMTELTDLDSNKMTGVTMKIKDVPKDPEITKTTDSEFSTAVTEWLADLSSGKIDDNTFRGNIKNLLYFTKE